MEWTYNPKLKAFARELRKKMTLGEVLLWQHLKGNQRYGYDFHRQHPLDEFIVDFFCPELALAIEVDGSTHDFKIGRDERRQLRLEQLGINFLRFTEKDVRHNLEGVVVSIDQWIKARSGKPT